MSLYCLLLPKTNLGLPPEALAGQYSLDQLLARLLLADEGGTKRARLLNVVFIGAKAHPSRLTGGRHGAEGGIEELDIVRALRTTQLKRKKTFSLKVGKNAKWRSVSGPYGKFSYQELEVAFLCP